MGGLQVVKGAVWSPTHARFSPVPAHQYTVLCKEVSHVYMIHCQEVYFVSEIYCDVDYIYTFDRETYFQSSV